MQFDKWKKKAIEEGRICPECKQPVSKKAWAFMTQFTPIRHCGNCAYAHWADDPFRRLGAGGSARMDNADREDLDRMRGNS